MQLHCYACSFTIKNSHSRVLYILIFFFFQLHSDFPYVLACAYRDTMSAECCLLLYGIVSLPWTSFSRGWCQAALVVAGLPLITAQELARLNRFPGATQGLAISMSSSYKTQKGNRTREQEKHCTVVFLFGLYKFETGFLYSIISPIVTWKSSHHHPRDECLRGSHSKCQLRSHISVAQPGAALASSSSANSLPRHKEVF